MSVLVTESNMLLFEDVFAFAQERHLISLRRASGQPFPWTTDEILQKHHFCSVYRELDRVTKWGAVNWREPNSDDPDLWFAMLVFRLINWPDTLQELGYPVPWNQHRFLEVMRSRKERGERVYNPAYMIRSDKSYVGRSKAEYQAEKQFGPWWENRANLRPQLGMSLNDYYAVLIKCYGIGSFMAGQAIADLKYVGPLKSSPDWTTFACSGPGSRRGLNRLLGRPIGQAWKELEWRKELRHFQDAFNSRWPWEPVHGQDSNNILCEGDKFLRAKSGQKCSLRKFKLNVGSP